MLCEPGTAQEDQTLDIVEEVGHSDLDRRASDADGSDEQLHAIFLFGKDVFDTGADLRFGVIGAANGFRHRFALGFLAVNMAGKAIAGDELLVLL